MRILSFGSLNFDFVYEVDHFLVPKETLPARSFYRNFGGKGLNQSVAMAKAGLNVYHAGCVGADGQPMIDFLEENGVHTKFIKKEDSLTSGHAIIEVCHAENRILLYGGANRAVKEDQIDEVLSHFEKEDCLVIQNEISSIPYLIRKAKEKSLFIFFNAAPMGAEVLEYPLELVDCLCVNEIEGAALLAVAGSKEENLTPSLIASHLHERFPKTGILLTAGEDGSYYYGKKENCHVPACRVKAVDTTAAGDTFSGYFLAGRNLGLSVKEAMKLASRAAAMTVQRPGAAESIPMASDIFNPVG